LLTSYVFLQLNKRFFFHHIDYDEGFFVWGGWCINKGLVPYRDFLEFKPPFVFLTHALAIKLHGFEGQRYRIFFAYFPLAACLSLLLALLQRGIPRLLAFSVGLATVMLFTIPKLHDTALSDSEGIGLAYYLFGTACLLLEPTSAGGRWRELAWVAGGIFLSCCALSKEPFGPCVGFTWIGGFLLNYRGEFRKEARRYAKWTLLGVALVLVGLCAYMIPTGSMRAYLAMAKGYARIYRDPALSYCVVLGQFKPDTPWNEFVVQYKQARREFLNFQTLGFLMPLSVLGAAYTAKRSAALFATVTFAVLAAMYAVTASNCQWNHYYTMTVAGLVFGLAVGADSIARAGRLSSMQNAIGVVLLVGVGVALWPRLGRELDREYAFPPFHEPVAGVFRYIAEHTTPEDRIFTTGPPHLYVETNRLSATRESNIIDEILGVYPEGSDEEKLRPLYDQLVKNRPKVVVLDPEHGWRKRRHYAALVMPFLRNYGYTEVLPGVYLRP
jgi:hypothetical protein